MSAEAVEVEFDDGLQISETDLGTGEPLVAITDIENIGHLPGKISQGDTVGYWDVADESMNLINVKVNGEVAVVCADKFKQFNLSVYLWENFKSIF